MPELIAALRQARAEIVRLRYIGTETALKLGVVNRELTLARSECERLRRRHDVPPRGRD
ncbi:hypothetical protein MUNTM_29170 [Mycobacterium sp. MUNTM1]